MLPFAVRLRSGLPVYQQLLAAVRRAVATGQLGPGDRFPSARALSQELRISPNTTRKVVAALAQEGLLEVAPGTGTVVARAEGVAARQRREILDRHVQHVATEARAIGLDLADVLESVRRQWEGTDRSPT